MDNLGKNRCAKNLCCPWFLLLLLLSILLFVGCNRQHGLPSRADVEKVQPGMTVAEAAEILGQAPTSFGSGVWYVSWKLDDGSSAYTTIVQGADENGNRIYTVGTMKNDHLNAGSGGPLDPYLLGGIVADWNDFERYAGKENLQLPTGFLYPTAFACLGEDPVIRYVSNQNIPTCYQYILTMWKSPTFDYLDLEINIKIQGGVSQLPYNTTALPTEATHGQSSMLKLNVNESTDSVVIYNRNDLLYVYDAQGNLRAIEWIDNGVYFCMSDDAATSWQYFLDYIPEAMPEDSVLRRLLSLDDAVAMDAWNELKTYIRENNKKPIDWKPIMLGTGAVVLVVGIGVTTWIVVHKKRKKAAAEQSVAIPEPISEE